MDETALETKGELLGELGQYPREAVQDVLGRLSEAIGGGHAPSVDLEQHLLRVTRDVLKGRRREELAREYGPVLAATSELLWLIDQDQHVISCNERAAASLGYTPKELEGKSNEMLKAEGQDWSEPRRQLEMKGEHEDVTLARHKDGTTVPVAWEASAFTIAGRRCYLVRTTVLASGRRARARRTLVSNETSYWTTVAAGSFYACAACEILERGLGGTILGEPVAA